jgi:hypothetical protein
MLKASRLLVMISIVACVPLALRACESSSSARNRLTQRRPPTHTHTCIHACALYESLSRAPVQVVFNLVPRFLEATLRQYAFMTKGLAETESTLRKRNIPMILVKGSPSQTLPALVAKERPAAVVTDMSPLRVPSNWALEVAAALDKLDPAVPLHQVSCCTLTIAPIITLLCCLLARSACLKRQTWLAQLAHTLKLLPPLFLCRLTLTTLCPCGWRRTSKRSERGPFERKSLTSLVAT